MTAFAAITLDDAASAAAVFSPSTIDPNGVAKLFENVSGQVFDSRRAISLGVKLPKNGGNVARVTAKVVVPVMDPNDSSIKIGEVIANCEFVLPKTATDTQRADALAFMANFLADASVVAAVGSLESIY
uniref:Coat protein n=1 Tax=Leviviridae sp. TaxID=2027243 RepID=A0A514D8C9_9VIRU|nr:MAG: hypothetical protein H4BulkL22317e12091_000002 [Leviviridae sp.]